MRIILISSGHLPVKELLKLLLEQQPSLMLTIQDYPDPTPLIRLCTPVIDHQASQELRQCYNQSCRQPTPLGRSKHDPAALTRWRKHLRFRG
jgi:hypothetical protein